MKSNCKRLFLYSPCSSVWLGVWKPQWNKKNIFCHNKGWLELRNVSNLWAVYSISNRRSPLSVRYMYIHDTMFKRSSASLSRKLYRKRDRILNLFLSLHAPWLSFFLVKKMTKEILFAIHSFNKCIHRTNRYHEYC